MGHPAWRFLRGFEGPVRQPWRLSQEVRRAHFGRGLAVAGRQPFLGPPKSDAGKRTVSMPSLVVADISSHLNTFTQPEAGALVFTSPHGMLLPGSPARRERQDTAPARVRARTGSPRLARQPQRSRPQAGRRSRPDARREGPELGGPWSDHLEGAVWELRIRLRGVAARITYR